MPKSTPDWETFLPDIETNNPVLLLLHLEREGRITREESTRLLMSHLEETGALRWREDSKCQKQLET